MSKKSAKPSKSKATLKEKTGSTSQKKSRTRSKRTTFPTSFLEVSASNLRDIWTTTLGESLSASWLTTPTSILEFSLRETTGSENPIDLAHPPRGIDIRIGPDGVEFRTQLDGPFHNLGSLMRGEELEPNE